MNTLVNFRVKHNLSQRQISNMLGVTLSYYSKVELGIRNPSYNFIMKFKDTFSNSNVDEIFFTLKPH